MPIGMWSFLILMMRKKNLTESMGYAKVLGGVILFFYHSQGAKRVDLYWRLVLCSWAKMKTMVLKLSQILYDEMNKTLSVVCMCGKSIVLLRHRHGRYEYVAYHYQNPTSYVNFGQCILRGYRSKDTCHGCQEESINNAPCQCHHYDAQVA